MKKLLVLVFAIALCLGVLCLGASADGITPSQPTQGDGTAENPYQISSAAELYWFAGLVNGDTSIIGSGVQQNTDAHAELTNDITIQTITYDNDGKPLASDLKQWTPIGGEETRDKNYTESDNKISRDNHI